TKRAAELGRRCIECVDRTGEAAPVSLLRLTAEACLLTGDVEAGRALLERAARAVEEAEAAGAPVPSTEAAGVLLSLGQRLVREGDPDGAEQRFGEAARLLAGTAHEREYAIALGERADVLQARGELDEALRIRRQEELPVYERLGDV